MTREPPNLEEDESSIMTIQRTTNHHSAPMPACLRAFVLAGQTGMAMSSRPDSRSYLPGSSNAHVGGSNGIQGSNFFKRGNGDVTDHNSVQLRGSA